MTTPINPQATPAARRLLQYLTDLPSGHILSGQHNFPATISTYYDRVHTLTGRYPAVWGQDFGFAAEGDKDSIYARDQIIVEAIRQHQHGAIITLMWHAVRPTDDEPGTFSQHVQGEISAQTYAELVTPGTAVHQRWLAQTDRIAGYLKQLQKADVPVLWRPYHEMNGNWFWWGHKPGTRLVELWKQHYHRLTEHHGLNNLIWVWTSNAPTGNNVLDYATMFPGHAYADILATDIYHGNYRQEFYADLLTLADGKPIAIGECAELPTPQIIARQPAWRWFMAWTDMLETHNSRERILELYHAPCAIYRDHPTLSWKAWQAAHGEGSSL